MVSLKLGPAAGKPRLHGYLVLFGYLALFVAFFFLAIGTWRSYRLYVESTKWPAVEAQVAECSVNFTYGYDGKIYGKKYRTQCVFEYSVGMISCRQQIAVGSIVFRSNKQIQLTRPKVTLGALQDWVRAHPRGSMQTIHYNPADPRQISLAGADSALMQITPLEQLRVGEGLFLLGIAVVFAAAILRNRAEAS